LISDDRLKRDAKLCLKTRAEKYSLEFGVDLKAHELRAIYKRNKIALMRIVHRIGPPPRITPDMQL
jgi:hypothetical protein